MKKLSVSTCLCVAVCLLASARADADSIFYTSVWGASTFELESFNGATGIATDIGPMGVSGRYGGLAYDTANSTLYFIDGEGDGTTEPMSLYTVNISTGLATLVGSHGIDQLAGLTYDSATDTLYASTNTAQSPLYILNKLTGAATPVGTQISASSTAKVGTLAYDSTHSTLFGLADCIGCAVLYTIDPSTGVGTVVQSTGLDTNNSGMVYDPISGLLWDLDVQSRITTIDPLTYVQTSVATFNGGESSGLALINTDLGEVPEPATFALFGAGAGLIWLRRRYGR